MIYRAIFLILINSLLLSACGGGGSSSSGSDVVDKNVTRCIKVERVTISFEPGSESQYTNTCDFTVSLVYKFITSAKGPITLSPNARHTDIFGSVNPDGFIACRPPSQGTNRGSNLDVRLDCT